MRNWLWSLVVAMFFMLGSSDVFAFCGDSSPSPGEQCDDGNTAAGDGCSSSCQVEAGFACTAAIAGIPPAPSTPSVCSYGSGTIQISGPSQVDEDSGSATLAVSRTGGSLGEVRVSVNTADGTAIAPLDYTAIVGLTITFADNESGDKTVTVPIIDDTDPEFAENFTVSLYGVTGGATLGVVSMATVQINANDANSPPTAPVISSPSDGATVTIEGSPGDPFVVTWSASTDPDGDPLNYYWQLYEGIQFVFAADLSDRTTTQGLLTMGGMWQALNLEAGMEKGDSRTFNHRALVLDSINPLVEGPFASVTLVLGNTGPSADNDSFDATENTLLEVPAPGVLDGDTDLQNDALTAVLVFDVSNGTLNLSENGSFTYDPDENYCGGDGFTYKANDGSLDSNTATVTINVACRPDITSVDPNSQTADYSDAIATVTVRAVDEDTPTSDGNLTLSWSGSPSDPTDVGDPVLVGCVSAFDDAGQSCEWTVNGILEEAADVFTLTFTANDGANDSTCSDTDGCDHVLTVEAEDAVAELETYTIDNEVDAPGGDLGTFTFYFSAYEKTPDNATHGVNTGVAWPGDLNNMVPQMRLTPVGPGGVVDADSCNFIDDEAGGKPLPDESEDYDQVAFFECTFTNIEVNTYELEAYVNGGFYAGSVEDVFVVSDPSLGFTTGGGFFYWPETELVEDLEETCYPYEGDKTNFGFNFKYNKKQRNVQGSLLVMRHTLTPWPDCEASTFKVKSNSIDGMGLGDEEDAGGFYGWAAVSGKATFRDPNDENSGGNPFLLYVEDHGEQGCGQDPADEFWIEVDAPNVWVDPLGVDPAVDEPDATDDADAGDDVPIFCGNITVPHKSGKGGGDGGGPKEPNPNKPPKG